MIIEFAAENGEIHRFEGEYLGQQSKNSRFSDVYVIYSKDEKFLLKCPKSDLPAPYGDWQSDDWRVLFESEYLSLRNIPEGCNIPKPLCLCRNIIIDGENRYPHALLQEYISGRTLRELVQYSHHTADICRWLISMIDTLKKTNLLGLYHLDLREDNTIMSSDGTLYIIDYTGGYCAASENRLIMSSAVRQQLHSLPSITPQHCESAQVHMLFRVFSAFCTADERYFIKYDIFDPLRNLTLDELRRDFEAMICE